jgi:predicted O-methyltransferase YrrM
MVLSYAHGDGQELALFGAKGSTLLDAVGASIWSALSKPSTVETLAAKVASRFRTTAEACSADVMRLLEELAARQFVTTSAERSEPSRASPAAVRALVETIPAAGTHRHGGLVHGLVRWLKPATVVESGTWCGYLTAVIAVALAENHRGRLV